MEWLIQIEGNKIVQQISLQKDTYTLGRGTENDITFETPKVSRLHAVLVKEGEAYHVIDKDSTNHVFVNGEHVERKELASENIIHLSDEVILLYLSEETVADLLNHMWNAINKKDFLRLKEVTDQIISLDSLEHILHIVLQEVVKLVNAERGFIALTDAKGAIQKNTSIVHNIPLEQDDERESIFSHSTVRLAIETRENVFILRSGGDESFNFSHSIIALKLLSVMCAPLLFGNKLVGVLYVDSGYHILDFSDRDQVFFTILADHAAIAIENAKLYSRLQRSIRQLSLNESRLEALLHLHQMTQAPREEITAFALEKALELSRSEIGYIGFMNEYETLLSIDCWSKNVIHSGTGEAPMIYPLKEAGMWGETVNQRKPMIHNKLAALNPLQEGYPNGEITIARHLNIPMFEGGHIVAILGVGNKKSHYDTSDVRQLMLLMQAMWRLIQRKQVEESLQASEEKHRIVLGSVPDPVVVYDLEGRITYLNPSFTRTFKWTLKDPIRQTSEFVPDAKFAEAALIIEKITHGETVSGVETCRLTKAGEMVEVSISGAGFFDSHGKLQGYVLSFQNISERKKTEQEMKFLAYHDVLTRLPNRKAFYERLEKKLSHARHRMKSDRRTPVETNMWALLFLNLDRFQHVNDTLGHDVGDELLKVIAKRLRACLRQDDEIFRPGGDEFTVLVDDILNAIEVAKVAYKIQQAISRPCHIQNHELYVTVSIGISLYPDDGEEAEVLVKNADMALHAAKKERTGYHFFTGEMNKKAQERMQLENGLRAAIRNNQFLLHYQPLVDKTGRIVGMEALVRWQHPEKGMISPAQFIPLAEETKAIVVIGTWVLRTACQQLKKWHDLGYGWLYMSINVSTRQFREPDFEETVERVIESTGVDPQHLKLEVTESSIMEKPEEAIEKMNILCAKGLHFSIDDFGTGYSSLNQLKHFPIDTLKIDRSFVNDSTANRDDQEIIKAILSMAQNLHIETVAEGVETKEQQDFLACEGCETMQGYYFGRPLTVEAFEERLKTSGKPDDAASSTM